MTVAFRQDPVGGFDPHGETTGPTAELWTTGLMYETLVRLAPGYGFEPLLALSWDVSDDLLTWTFALREGVEFSDGAAFNAAAVKANFDHIFEVAASAGATLGRYFGAEDVEVIDEYTVAFHLSTPNSLFPLYLGQFPTGMVSPDAIADGVDLATEAVGTGPFLLDDVRPGNEVRFVRNPGYWGEDAQGTQLPYLDELTFRVMTDASQRLNAVRTGEAEIGMFLDISQKNQVGEAVAVIDPTSRLGAFTINSEAEPWTDPRLRQALSAALDREALLRVSQAGVGEPAFGLFPSQSDYYDPAVEAPEGSPYGHRDLELVGELLADAGYPDGLDVREQTIMAQAEWPDMVRAAESALAMLDEAGIHLGGVEVCPLAECGSIRRSGDWAMTTNPFPFPGDPYFTVYQMYSPTGTYNHGNGNFEHAGELSAELAAALDAPLEARSEDRFDLARAAQQALLVALPPASIPLFLMPQFDAAVTDVVNYDVRPYNLQRVWANVGFAS